MCCLANWALDGRSKKASIADFRRILHDTAVEMVQGARELRASAKTNGRQSVTILRRSAIGIGLFDPDLHSFDPLKEITARKAQDLAELV